MHSTLARSEVMIRRLDTLNVPTSEVGTLFAPASACTPALKSDTRPERSCKFM